MDAPGSVAVIGAGISGISAARAMRAKGFDVVVLDRARNLGGVWDPDRSYPNISTQTNRGQYSFSDFPMPQDIPEWPAGRDVHAYLEEYAKHNGDTDLIRFGRAVATVRRDPGSGEWEVTHDGEGGAEASRFTHVAVCTGIFNRPHVPQVPGMDAFRAAGGLILHTSQTTDPDLLVGKRVVVVGFQKSATDVASYSSSRAASTTLVYRRAMWKVPSHVLGVVNVKWLFYSRFVEAMSEPWAPTRGEKVLHTAGKPVVWAFWRLVTAIMKAQFRLKDADLVPEHRFETQIGCNLSVCPKGYYDAIREGRIVARRGTVAGYDAGEVYRNIVPPAEPTLGFVGYNSSLFCQLSAELSARWLAESWTGGITLPSSDMMARQVEDRLRWYREHRPMDLESYKNACVAPFNYRHFDELLRDLGAPTRKSRNRLLEGVRPLTLPHYTEHLSRVGGAGSAAASV